MGHGEILGHLSLVLIGLVADVEKFWCEPTR